MKKTLWIGFVTLAFAAPADAWHLPPYNIKGKCSIYLKVEVGNAALPLAPWYLYYPAEAQNQPIGPSLHYPNWPQPTAAAFGPMTPAPGGFPVPNIPPGVQRVNYQAPAYWYGE
jgi:hypothetical protein